jgi:hypothetical protein
MKKKNYYKKNKRTNKIQIKKNQIEKKNTLKLK